MPEIVTLLSSLRQCLDGKTWRQLIVITGESVGLWQSSREIAGLSQIYDLLAANSSAI